MPSRLRKTKKRHSYNTSPRKIIIETSVDDSEIEALRLQLAEIEKELGKAQRSWMERLQEAEDLRKSEMKLLRRTGLTLELSAEQKQPCLVNLPVDHQEMLQKREEQLRKELEKETRQ